MAGRIEVFTRTWWKLNSAWPDGREPHLGRPHHVCFTETEEEARERCREINATMKPGKLGSRAEFRTVKA